MLTHIQDKRYSETGNFNLPMIKRFWPNTAEIGHFKNDKLEGPGKRTDPNGQVEEGIFSNGVLIEPKTI